MPLSGGAGNKKIGAAAMPVKPKIAAMIATMKNPIAQLSIEPPTVGLDNRRPCKQRAGAALPRLS
jgi:hypothetical protein